MNACKTLAQAASQPDWPFVPPAIPLFISRVRAGFPSPAEDSLEARLNLHDWLVENPAATFFVRVEGDSMIDEGILSGDVLVVDRGVPIRDKSIIVAVVNGEFTVKRILMRKPGPVLEPANSAYDPIQVTDDMEFEIWGVVRYAIHSLC